MDGLEVLRMEHEGRAHAPAVGVELRRVSVRDEADVLLEEEAALVGKHQQRAAVVRYGGQQRRLSLQRRLADRQHRGEA